MDIRYALPRSAHYARLFSNLNTLFQIFPSVRTVRESLEGYSAGGCLPYSSEVASRQPWLRLFLHDWVGSSPGISRAAPHIKSYCRCSPDGKSIAWFLLTRCVSSFLKFYFSSCYLWGKINLVRLSKTILMFFFSQFSDSEIDSFVVGHFLALSFLNTFNLSVLIGISKSS